MKVVITGGAGYLGRKLCEALIKRGSLIDRFGDNKPLQSIVLMGRSLGDGERKVVDGILIESSRGSITDPEYTRRVIAGSDVTVFHLAAVLTGVTERDLSAAIDNNVTGTKNVLDALAACGEGSRGVMTSSVTVFRPDPEGKPVSDETAVRPATIYGHTKALGELLVSAYTKAGKVDGRCARIATVVARPHKIGSSAGASISDALRDITLGRECDVLLKPSTVAAIIDLDSCVDGLVRLQAVERGLIGDDVAVNFPALTVSIQQMIDEAAATARKHGRQPGVARFVPDQFAQSVIDGWATTIDATRAKRLGISCNADLASICERVLGSELAPDVGLRQP